MTPKSPKMNALVAWPYLDAGTIDFFRKNKDCRLLLDSGAFTAWKAGKVLSIDDYCRFLDTLGDVPWRYFTLDVVGDPEGTRRNLELLFKRGFKPIPIFTRGENESVLDDYYKLSDLVAIGGLVKTKGNKGFVKGIMQHVGDRRVHWLGFGGDNFVAHFKPYSFDSSTWSNAMRFGVMNFYLGNGKWLLRAKATFEKKPENIVSMMFRQFDIDIRRAQNKKEWVNSGSGKSVLEEVAFKSWIKYQLDIEKKLKSKYFMACAAPGHVSCCKRAFDFWTKSIKW